MKQRVIAMLLTICILLSVPTSVLAEETETLPPSYYRLTTEISDIAGDFTMELDFMIPGDKEGVYVNAEQFSQATGSLGYAFDQTYQQCAFVNKTTNHVVMFQFGSTDTAVYYMGSCLEYEAPMPALFIDGVTWIPFDFAIKLFHCSYRFGGKTLSISTSEMTPLTAVSYIYSAREDFSFDWVDEVGYSELDVIVMSGSARVVNFVNGLLSFESSSWATLLTCLVGSTYPYDKEFAEDIALLFISPSQSEMKGAALETAGSVSGGLGKMVDTTGTITEMVGASLKKGDVVGAYGNLTGSFPQFLKDGKLAKQIASIKKNDGLLSKGNGLLSDFANKLKVHPDADLNYIEVFSYLVGICEYYVKFENKSDYAVAALNEYAQYSRRDEASVFSSYVQSLDTPWVGAMEQYLKDNMDSIVTASIPFDKLLGGPATLTLIGWDIVSNVFPFFKDGLDSTKNFELSEYAIVYQDESAELIGEMRAECLTKKGIKEENLDNLVNSAYAYLKFSMIARNAGSASMQTGKLDEDIKTVKLQEMEQKNEKIGRYLNILEVEDTNDLTLYGFLPSENKSYLSKWDDSDLIRFLTTVAESIEGSSQSTQPKAEINLFPNDEETVITEEEAIQMVKDSVGKSFAGLFDSLFADVYTFRVTDSYYVEEEEILTYVVQMQVEDQDDGYRFFVPVNGEHVWMGMINSDGSYIYYTQIDLKDWTFSSIMSSLGDLYEEVQEEEMNQ